MGTASDQDDLIGAIYDAALDRTRWPAALESIRRELATKGIQLVALDKASAAASFSCTAGIEYDAEFEYIRRYSRSDPRVPTLIANPTPGYWLLDHQVLSDEQMRQSPFYQELIFPAGVHYLAATKLYEDADLVVVFAMFRALGERPYGNEEITNADRLMPHLRRAVQLGLSQFRYSVEALVGVEIVDRLRYPIFVLDADGRIVHCNSSASALLENSTILQSSDRRLQCDDPQNQRLLQLAIRAVHDDAKTTQQEPKAHLLSLTRPGQRPLKGFLLALLPRSSMGVFGPAMMIMASFSSTDAGSLPEPAFLMAAYDLTPAEARVALGIARGMNASGIAANHKIKVSTVRSQIRSILTKTGCESQAALIVELLSLPGLSTAQGKRPMSGEVPNRLTTDN